MLTNVGQNDKIRSEIIIFGSIMETENRKTVRGGNKKRILFLSNHFIGLYAYRRELIRADFITVRVKAESGRHNVAKYQ